MDIKDRSDSADEPGKVTEFKDWTLPRNAIIIPSEKSFDDKDTYCPEDYSCLVHQNHTLNEWVLNKLPLSDEKKKWLLSELVTDHMMYQSQEKWKVKMKKLRKNKKGKCKPCDDHHKSIKDEHSRSIPISSSA